MNRVDISTCARVAPSLTSLHLGEAKFGEPINLTKTISVEQDTLGQVTINGEKQASPAHLVLNDLISKGGKIESTKTTWTIVFVPRVQESEGFLPFKGVIDPCVAKDMALPLSVFDEAQGKWTLTKETFAELERAHAARAQERAAQLEKEVKQQETMRAQQVKMSEIPKNTTTKEGGWSVGGTLEDLEKEYIARKELETLKKTHGHNQSDTTLKAALNKINKLEKLIEQSKIDMIEGRGGSLTHLINEVSLVGREISKIKSLSLIPEDSLKLELREKEVARKYFDLLQRQT